ncbi:hypothetical protein SAMN04489761_1082 [Tenacibaculum sp. MAR_2009_124]|nr:hypothetical protein SAMN04489761_1082 [Tenacibaculum sp. MAR_2009_124]
MNLNEFTDAHLVNSILLMLTSNEILDGAKVR